MGSLSTHHSTRLLQTSRREGEWRRKEEEEEGDDETTTTTPFQHQQQNWRCCPPRERSRPRSLSVYVGVFQASDVFYVLLNGNIPLHVSPTKEEEEKKKAQDAGAHSDGSHSSLQ